VAGFRVVVKQIVVGDQDVMAVFVAVCDFVDGIGDAVGFDNHKQRRVRAADFQEPRFSEPLTGVDHRNVVQFVAVEFGIGFDFAHQGLRNKKLYC